MRCKKNNTLMTLQKQGSKNRPLFNKYKQIGNSLWQKNFKKNKK